MAAPNPSGQNLPTSPTPTLSLQAAHRVARTNHIKAAASRQSQHWGPRGGKAGPHPGVPGHSCVQGALGTLPVGQGLPGGCHPHPPGQKTRRSLMTLMPERSPQSSAGMGRSGSAPSPLLSLWFN